MVGTVIDDLRGTCPRAARAQGARRPDRRASSETSPTGRRYDGGDPPGRHLRRPHPAGRWPAGSSSCCEHAIPVLSQRQGDDRRLGTGIGDAECSPRDRRSPSHRRCVLGGCAGTGGRRRGPRPRTVVATASGSPFQSGATTASGSRSEVRYVRIGRIPVTDPPSIEGHVLPAVAVVDVRGSSNGPQHGEVLHHLDGRGGSTRARARPSSLGPARRQRPGCATRRSSSPVASVDTTKLSAYHPGSASDTSATGTSRNAVATKNSPMRRRLDRPDGPGPAVRQIERTPHPS